MKTSKRLATLAGVAVLAATLFIYGQGRTPLRAQFVPAATSTPAVAPAVTPATTAPAAGPAAPQPSPALPATATPSLSYFPRATATPATEAQGSSTATDREQDVRERLSRARSDCRSLATAMESYFVDNNTYPSSLPRLTTPIAYMMQIPQDQFSSKNDTLKMQSSQRSWLAYSIGPDQKDDRGLIAYDATNGTFSKGDIIRVKQ